MHGLPSRSSRWLLAAPVRLRPRFAQATPDTLRPDGLRMAAPRVARLRLRGLRPPVRLRFRFTQARPDTLRPDGLRMAAPRVARQGEAWWACLDSNQEPDRYERPALTIELQARAASRRPTRGAASPYNAVWQGAMGRRHLHRRGIVGWAKARLRAVPTMLAPMRMRNGGHAAGRVRVRRLCPPYCYASASLCRARSKSDTMMVTLSAFQASPLTKAAA